MSNWMSAIGIIVAAAVAIGIALWQMEATDCANRRDWAQKRLDIFREIKKETLSIRIMRLPDKLDGKSDEEIREIGNNYFMQFNEGVIKTREIFMANRTYYSDAAAEKIDRLWEDTTRAEKAYEESKRDIELGSRLYNARIAFLQTFYDALDAEIDGCLRELRTSACRPNLFKFSEIDVWANRGVSQSVSAPGIAI